MTPTSHSIGVLTTAARPPVNSLSVRIARVSARRLRPGRYAVTSRLSACGRRWLVGSQLLPQPSRDILRRLGLGQHRITESRGVEVSGGPKSVLAAESW